MVEMLTDHPGRDALQAYGQGRLAPAAVAALEQHLGVCASCCQLLDAAPGDSFVSRLRDADSGESSRGTDVFGAAVTVVDAPEHPSGAGRSPSLPRDWSDRPGRHGGGLPGRAPAHGPPGRPEGHSSRPDAVPGGGAALPAGGAGGGPAAARQHRHRLRRRPGGRPALPGHGIHRGEQPRRSGARSRPTAGGRGLRATPDRQHWACSTPPNRAWSTATSNPRT